MGVEMTATECLVEQVKADGEDFEWYPTTAGMVGAVWQHMKGRHSGDAVSLLDVGAGDGRLFTICDELSGREEYGMKLGGKFAIEKARALIKAMPADVCMVGTDFETDTLIDKSVNVVFSNPPYSCFERWAVKVITEANAGDAYLILPERWAVNGGIKAALERRKAQARVIYSDDFLTADRAARARVDVIHVRLRSGYNGGATDSDVDPFGLWFNEHFRSEIEGLEDRSTERSKPIDERMGELVQGRNQVEVMAELYRADLDHLLSNYKAVGQLDPVILKELGVTVGAVCEGLESKIKGLKHVYWRELFEKMKSITKRLTKGSRETMLERLNAHTQVDFTIDNVYAVVMWALKNANRYIDTQLLDLYMRMSSEENIRNYKSNAHFVKDTWRSSRGEFFEDHHHYALEYRLVLENYKAILDSKNEWCSSWDYKGNLHTDAHDYLGDIFVVARNLGFDVMNDSLTREWESNETQEFLYWTEDGPELFAEVRAFKNGNIHIKACRGFVRALNIEAARLNGWVKSAAEAAAQLALPLAECEERFGCNLQLTGAPLLLGAGA